MSVRSRSPSLLMSAMSRLEFLELGRKRAAHFGLLQFGVLCDQRDPAFAVFLLARELAADFRALQFLGLGDQRDLAVAVLLRAGQRAADFRCFARRRFLDDGDLLLDLRGLQRLLLADFLLFDFPAPLENETLLLAQYPRPLVGDLLFLLGRSASPRRDRAAGCRAGSRGSACAPKAPFLRST